MTKELSEDPNGIIFAVPGAAMSLFYLDKCMSGIKHENTVKHRLLKKYRVRFLPEQVIRRELVEL